MPRLSYRGSRLLAGIVQACGWIAAVIVLVAAIATVHAPPPQRSVPLGYGFVAVIGAAALHVLMSAALALFDLVDRLSAPPAARP